MYISQDSIHPCMTPTDTITKIGPPLQRRSPAWAPSGTGEPGLRNRKKLRTCWFPPRHPLPSPLRPLSPSFLPFRHLGTPDIFDSETQEPCARRRARARRASCESHSPTARPKRRRAQSCGALRAAPRRRRKEMLDRVSVGRTDKAVVLH